MLARCRVHEVSQEWGCEWGSSYMNESIHSVSSHDCRFLPNRMRGGSLVITPSARDKLYSRQKVVCAVAVLCL